MNYQEAISDIQRHSDVKTGINTIYWLTEEEIKQKLTLYADDKVREALDRVQHVRDHKPESEWSSFGLSADMWDEIEAIRKELQ